MLKELKDFINNPYDGEVVFKLANLYFNQTQTASALSYYLRVTECETSNELIYESLIKGGLCLYKQGNRIHSTKALYMHAISLLPKRPEAYFLLARLYEENKEWFEAYTLSTMALNVCDFDLKKLKTYVEYPGLYGFIFENAVSSWWMGKIEESLNLFLDLDKNYKMEDIHIKSVKENIKYLTNSWHIPVFYSKNKMNNLRFKFDGYNTIQSNYSQCFQDMFVLSALNGKKKGKYLEIGSADPFFYSNTALLEIDYEWTGISLEINKQEVDKFRKARKNECLHTDALKVNYKELLDNANLGTDWDFLQLDCEPPINTYLILLEIPFDKYRFAVITYEHDYYCDETKSYREKSRRYLQTMGYELVVGNISPDDNSPFEDWWVHPDLVDPKIIEILKSSKEINPANKYIFEIE